MKLDWPPPFGGVCGLCVPLMRDRAAASVGELPIGWCARRHDTEGGVCPSAKGALGEARIDDTGALVLAAGGKDVLIARR